MWGVTKMVATNFGSSISLCPETVWASVCCCSMAVVSLGAWLWKGHQPAISVIISMDWFKGKSTGNHGFNHQILGFPVNFPIIQFYDHPRICQLAKRHNMIDTRRMVVPWSVWKTCPLWTTTLNFCRHFSGCPNSVINFLMASMVVPSSLEWSACRCGQSFLKGAPGEQSTRK